MARIRQPPPISIIGVGSGGSKVVEYLLQDGFDYWTSCVVDTDRQALAESNARHKILIGEQIVGGTSSNGDLIKSRQAMNESIAELQEIVTNIKQVVVITCLGGGTGGGATPIIGKFTQDNHLKTIGVVGLPFYWEGHKRMMRAQEGLKDLSDIFDPLYVLWPQRLLPLFGGKRSLSEVLDLVTRMLAQRVISHYTNVDLSNFDWNVVMAGLE